MLDFSRLLIITCTISDSERMIVMEHLNMEVWYRTAEWIFTNMIKVRKIEPVTKLPKAAI